MNERLSDRVRSALEGADAYAADLRHARVLPEHVVVALMADRDGAVARVVRELGSAPEQIEQRLHRDITKRARPGGSPTRGPELERMLDDATRQARRDKDDVVRTTHLLVAIADGPPGVARDALERAGITRSAVRYALRDADELRRLEKASNTMAPSGGGPKASSGPTRDGRPTRKKKAKGDDDPRPMFERFGRDLTDMARRGALDPIVGRDDEIRRIMQILGRRTKNNPVIIGEPGVGKTAVVEGFAYRLIGDDLPHNLRNKRLIELDLGAMVAGTTLRGQFEERVKRLVEEIASAQGSVILYIDELHALVGAGGSGDGGGAADMLKPALARGEITIIGTTTQAEYRKHIESDKALERRFQEIAVDEPSRDETVAILRGIKERYEAHHRVRITDAAVQAAVELSDRYVTDRMLPDKAVDLIDEAASRLRMQMDSQPTELYELSRSVANLEMEAEALSRESGALASKKREAIEEELGKQRTTLSEKQEQLAEEKALLDRVAELTREIEATRKLSEQAHADGDLGRAAELRYGVIKQLEQERDAQQAALEARPASERLVREDVSEEDIAGVVGDWTGIPTTKMLESERQKILAVGDRLAQRVIGQPEAVEAIAGAVRRSRAGVQHRNRPIGSFFFVGPTGVGKTELAKALADFLFDSEDALIRIDMSEYMEQSKVNTLIGAAYGYVDSDKGGMLTEAVRQRPYSVVLFDEAEKAHPDVFNILLQVLDEGRLTDSQGRRIDFTNTIVIMTSNVGARRILDLSGSVEYEELQTTVMDILKDHFKPEFLNRIDEKVVFNALDRDALTAIAEILFRSFGKLLAEQELEIRFSDAAKQRIIDVGYQPEYGARPLKRALLTEVQDPLALLLLEGRFEPGDTIDVDAGENGELTFSKG